MIRARLFGTYNANHPANRLLAEAFAAAGCAIETCHEPLWERTRDKHAAFFSGRSLARLGAAYARTAARLARRWRRLGKPDLAVAGFNGQLDVLLLRALTRGRVPIVFAPLVTITETLVDDRRVWRRRGAQARLASALDRRSLEAADLVLLDTEAHRQWVGERLTDRARTATLYLGADHIFESTPPRVRRPGDPLRVLFYGQYLPLHGPEVIVRAAGLLGYDAGVEVTMIGTGPEREAAEQIAREREYKHIRFEDWVPFEELPRRLAESDVALGVFGVSAKARMVIPTKVYQGAAAARCVVTGDTPAVREVFTPDEDIITVPRGDPGALARALRRLRDDDALVGRIGSAAGRLMHEHLDARAHGRRVAALLRETFPRLAAALAPGAEAPGP